MTEINNKTEEKADKLLTDFKARMKIFHSSEDDYLKLILEASTKAIFAICGTFDVDTYSRGRELIIERGRYAYNDALEYFNDNFREDIINISLDLMVGDSDGD